MLLLLLVLIGSSLYLVRRLVRRRAACSPSSTARATRSALLDSEYERLKAEKQAQATPLRVEKVARDKLAMRTATPAVTQYVTDARAASGADGGP